MVLVMTPGALESEIVRKEWRLARQRGFCVVSVFGAPHLDMWSLPDWMGDTHFVDTANPEQWKRLLRQFEGPGEDLRVPSMADDLPPDFAPQPQEFEPLVASVLNERKKQPVAERGSERSGWIRRNHAGPGALSRRGHSEGISRWHPVVHNGTEPR